MVPSTILKMVVAILIPTLSYSYIRNVPNPYDTCVTMVHTLTPVPCTSALISTPLPSPGPQFQRVGAQNGASVQTTECKTIDRRSAAVGFAGALLGLSIGDQNSDAAGRRPPPPPPKEKQDPNISGVQAKVLASKKRKEAFKEAVSKLREKGKSAE